jgi:hypothetical protein
VKEVPLVGISLFIQRNQGAMINPYLVNLRNIAAVNRFVDTVGIIENGGELSLSAGNDKVEKINAVLPLFSLKKD